MGKSQLPLGYDQIKTIQQSQTRREILDKVWTVLVIGGLLAVVVYSIVIQILHHP
jgi:hypothetical protein